MAAEKERASRDVRQSHIMSCLRAKLRHFLRWLQLWLQLWPVVWLGMCGYCVAAAGMHASQSKNAAAPPLSSGVITPQTRTHLCCPQPPPPAPSASQLPAAIANKPAIPISRPAAYPAARRLASPRHVSCRVFRTLTATPGRPQTHTAIAIAMSPFVARVAPRLAARFRTLVAGSQRRLMSAAADVRPGETPFVAGRRAVKEHAAGTTGELCCSGCCCLRLCLAACPLLALSRVAVPRGLSTANWLCNGLWVAWRWRALPVQPLRLPWNRHG